MNHTNQTFRELYRRLDQADRLDGSLKAALRAFLKEQAALYRTGNHRPEEIALRTARLMSTSAVASIDNHDDPYLAVLLLAAQLELPPAHRGTATWAEFAERVDALAGA